MEESRKLYEMYKGRKVRVGGFYSGTVVGWSCYQTYMVAELKTHKGWCLNNEGRHFIGKEYKAKAGRLYWYVTEADIIR